MPHEAVSFSLESLALAYREGRARVRDVVESAIARHDSLEPAGDAYIEWSPEHARAQADAADAIMATGVTPAPLFGIPVSVKDLYGLNGFRTCAGSPRPLPPAWEREGPIVAGLRRDLAIMMGKTHTVEFAFGGLGTNPHHPVPRNPWDRQRHRVPGGSSSGAGVSLVEGSAMVAFGSDTGGSVRIPASLTGTVGLKTSIGRWSTDGIVPLSRTLDTAGILTRTVADAIYAFAAMDPEGGDPAVFARSTGAVRASDLRIGVADDFFWADCDPGVAEVVRTALGELEKAGAKLVDMAMPETAEVHEMFRSGGPVAPELHAFLTRHLPEWLETLDPNVRARMASASEVTATEYLRRLDRLEELSAAVAERMLDVDVIAGPTVPIAPPTLSELSDHDVYRHRNLLMLRNTSIGNYLDMCAITFPAGTDADGLPVGLQLAAPAGAEPSLVAAASACVRVLGDGPDRIGG